ncbi:MAG: hypothetical protein IH608_03645, partial [Proteobacteria bacterium]|nr:hypothetical protein [Pseudomonadota bacterium]
MGDPMSAWDRGRGPIGKHVRAHAERTLAAYRAQPERVEEDLGIEVSIRTGGYGHRQLFELVQNAADAVLEGGRSGKVQVVLTESALYCANEGEPIDVDGVTAILMSHVSRKGGTQIGHFGVGFKSVLAVTRRPQFFSRSGSLGFDADRSAERIRRVVPETANTPVLRLAEVLDPLEAAREDPCLAELMTWATTVVRLPGDADSAAWLPADLEAFPSAFQLFSPHVSTLILEDRVSGLLREVRTAPSESHVELSEGGTTARWRVFQSNLPIGGLSGEARRDADPQIVRRDALPIVWAVPDDGSKGTGRFWAFFPTEQVTTLTGILNAPWKTNSDRQNLLEGPFNYALLDGVVDLVARVWPGLLDPRDPGAVLDLLPARDPRGWADEYLGKELYKRLAGSRSVPSAGGSLREPSKLKLRPEAILQPTVLQWVQETGEGAIGTGWCHPSVERRERRPRASKLGCASTATIAEWISAVAGHGSPGSSLRAITLAGALWGQLPSHEQGRVRQTAFVLTDQGVLAAPGSGKLFLPRPGGIPEGDMAVVHEAIARDPKARDALTRIGLLEVSALAE